MLSIKRTLGADNAPAKSARWEINAHRGAAIYALYCLIMLLLAATPWLVERPIVQIGCALFLLVVLTLFLQACIYRVITRCRAIVVQQSDFLFGIAIVFISAGAGALVAAF